MGEWYSLSAGIYGAVLVDGLRFSNRHQQVIKTPIVRNGKQATVGYAPEVWKGWV